MFSLRPFHFAQLANHNLQQNQRRRKRELDSVCCTFSFQDHLGQKKWFRHFGWQNHSWSQRVCSDTVNHTKIILSKHELANEGVEALDDDIYQGRTRNQIHHPPVLRLVSLFLDKISKVGNAIRHKEAFSPHFQQNAAMSKRICAVIPADEQDGCLSQCLCPDFCFVAITVDQSGKESFFLEKDTCCLFPKNRPPDLFKKEYTAGVWRVRWFGGGS